MEKNKKNINIKSKIWL